MEKQFKTVRNWKVLANTVLKYMTNVEMIKYLEENNFQRLSTKATTLQSRSVYALNERVVIKVARNNAGLQQNYSESNVDYYLESKDRKYFAKIYNDVHLFGNAILMERVQPFKCNKQNNALLKKQREVIEAFHKEVSDRSGSIYIQDLFSDNAGVVYSNLGIRGNQIVALDYGYSEYVKQMYRSARSPDRMIRARTRHNEFGLQTV